MEYLPGKTLMTVFNEKQTLPLNNVKTLLRKMLQIVKECHENNIIHRDIKPHNIIVSSCGTEPKIIDFGLAIITTREMEPYNYCKCGTMGYTAPEVLLTDSMFYKSYGYKCDLFSLGVVAHMLLMGYNPLAGKSDSQRKKDIKVELREKEIVEKYDDNCFNFLKNLLCSNPKHRYSASEALRSKFLREDSEEEGVSPSRTLQSS